MFSVCFQFLLFLVKFVQNLLFLVDFFLEKNIQNPRKYISKYLFQDSYRIRTTRFQNYLVIPFKLTNSSLKKNSRTAIFWQTVWILLCSKPYQKFLAIVKFLMKKLVENKNCKHLSLKWVIIRYLMWLYYIFGFG